MSGLRRHTGTVLLAPVHRAAQRLAGWVAHARDRGVRLTAKAARGWLLLAVVGYVAAIVGSRWLGWAAIAAGVPVVLAGVAAAWRVQSRARAALVTALWLPLHLLLILSGGAVSPVFPLAIAWLIAVALMGTPVLLAGAAAAALATSLAADAWTAALTVAGALTAFTSLLTGFGAGALLNGYVRVTARGLRRLARIEEEAAGGGESLEARAVARMRELYSVLARLSHRYGAHRATLWEVDPQRQWSVPFLVVGGNAPGPVRLEGSPLGWAWEERLALRADSPPDWAADAAAISIAPLEDGHECSGLVTFEHGRGVPLPDLDALAESASVLHSLISSQRREARAHAARQRAERLLELAGRLPDRLDSATFAAELADSARAFVSGTGAAVAVWEDEAGRLLAVVGEDGGPAPGTMFAAGESEFALAARGGTSLRRRYRRTESRSLPIAVPGERWFAEPIALAVIPLIGTDGAVIGLLGVWNARAASLDPEGLTALESIAPFAAVHLRHARAFAALAEGPVGPGR